MDRATRDPVIVTGLIINWSGRFIVAGTVVGWAWWLTDARLIVAGLAVGAMVCNPWRPKRSPAIAGHGIADAAKRPAPRGERAALAP